MHGSHADGTEDWPVRRLSNALVGASLRHTLCMQDFLATVHAQVASTKLTAWSIVSSAWIHCEILWCLSMHVASTLVAVSNLIA